MVSDPVSLNYILNSPHFAFGPTFEDIIYLVFGKKSMVGVNGAFTSYAYVWTKHDRPTEGDHKRIRAALNVGFTAAAVRNYLPMFEKAAQTVGSFG